MLTRLAGSPFILSTAPQLALLTCRLIVSLPSNSQSDGYECLQVMPAGAAGMLPLRRLPSAEDEVSESQEAAPTLAPTPALKRKASAAAEVQQPPTETRLHVRRRLLDEDDADSGV